jgi:beta-lactamase class D
MRRSSAARFAPALLLGIGSVFAAGPRDPIGPEVPWVVVDYSTRTESYRVVGDVSLLSQRFSPGTSFQLVVAIVALESAEITTATELPIRSNGAETQRSAGVKLPEALREAHGDFFAQVLKRTGYEPVREFLVRSRYAATIPDAVGSFADLVRGEPLRVTVFEQNLFWQALSRRALPLQPGTLDTLERLLEVEAARPAWGKAGVGEVSAQPGRSVSWFSGVVRLRDGTHVVTAAALTKQPDPVAVDLFRKYLAAPRR